MFDSLLIKIQDEKTRIKEKLNLPNEEAIFLQHFQESNSLSSPNNIVNIDLCDFLIAYLRAGNMDLSFQEIYDFVYTSFDFIENSNTHDCLLVLASIDIIMNEYGISKAKKYLDPNTKFSFLEQLKIGANVSTAISMLRSYQKRENVDFSGIYSLFEKDKGLCQDAFSFYFAFKDMKSIQSHFCEAVDSIKEECGVKLSSKSISKSFRDTLKNEYHWDSINVGLNRVKNYTEHVIHEDKTLKKRLNRDLINYSLLEEFIRKNKNNDTIYPLPKDVLKIENEEIKLEFLKLVYQRNLYQYQGIKQKYDHLSSNSFNQYSILFHKFGLDINQYHIRHDVDISEVEAVLKKLSSLQLENSEVLLDILNHSSINKINHVFSYLDKGFISIEFVKNNLDIFNECYNNLVDNINCLQANDVTVSLIQKLEDILKSDTSKISFNLKLLQEYDLAKYLKKTENFMFLATEMLDKKIDRVLENGLESYLKIGLDLLNYSVDDLMKVSLFKKIHIPIENDFELKQILENRSISILPEQIKDYLFNKIPYIDSLDGEIVTKDEFLQTLSSYTDTNRVYNINGVFISKNKILRNLVSIDDNLSPIDQFRVITSDMILDDKECETVISSVIGSNKCLLKK